MFLGTNWDRTKDDECLRSNSPDSFVDAKDVHTICLLATVKNVTDHSFLSLMIYKCTKSSVWFGENRFFLLFIMFILFQVELSILLRDGGKCGF